MYKSRIKNWGLDKNTKEAEARALLRMKMKRDAVGKDSAFCVRGKTVTTEDALRYFKRKGILNPGVEAQPAEVSTPPEIECWTPLSSPAPGFITIQTHEEEDVQRGADLLEFYGAEIEFVSCRSTTLDSTQGNDDTQLYLNIDQIRRVLFSSLQVQSFEYLIHLCHLNVLLYLRSSSLASRPIMAVRLTVGFSKPMMKVISLMSTRQQDSTTWTNFTVCAASGPV